MNSRWLNGCGCSHYALIIMATMALTSCDYLFPSTPQPAAPKSTVTRHIKHVKTPKPVEAASADATDAPAMHPPASVPALSIKPADFVRSLSLARLTLSSGAAGNATTDLEMLKSYGSQNAAAQSVNLLIIDYKTDGIKRNQQAIAPVIMQGEKAEFPALAEIMDKLGASHTLYDIHPVKTTISAPALDFSDSSPAQIKETLDAQQQQLISQATALPPTENARIELQLADFFMQHHLRDAAYLSVDNVKQSLAAAAQAPMENPGTIAQLSQSLESLENQLHKTMPFGF